MKEITKANIKNFNSRPKVNINDTIDTQSESMRSADISKDTANQLKNSSIHRGSTKSSIDNHGNSRVSNSNLNNISIMDEVMDDGLKERLEFLQKNNLLLNEKLNRIETEKQEMKLKYQEERKQMDSQVKELNYKIRGLSNSQEKVMTEVTMNTEDLNEKFAMKEETMITMKKQLSELEKEKHSLQSTALRLETELEDKKNAEVERDLIIQQLQLHIDQMTQLLDQSNHYISDLSKNDIDKNNLKWLVQDQ